jgi:hypothetical protein
MHFHDSGRRIVGWRFLAKPALFFLSLIIRIHANTPMRQSKREWMSFVIAHPFAFKVGRKY